MSAELIVHSRGDRAAVVQQRDLYPKSLVAPPTERGELLATALVIAYLAFSLPAVAAGFATTSFGLHPTTVVYSTGVVGLSVIALVAQRKRAAQ